jgi:hypothetical protein
MRVTADDQVRTRFREHRREVGFRRQDELLFRDF